MELTDYTINFADTSAEYNPVHTIVPQLAMNQLSFTLVILSMQDLILKLVLV